MTPAAWNAGVFSMIRQLSETVILPIAGLVLTFVMTYEPVSYTHLIGKGIEEVVNLGFDIIISYNIGSENISLAKRCRKRNIRFYYVLHDPWMGLTGLVKEGKKALRICAAAIVNAVICRNSYCVLLPSQAGVNYYKRAHIVYLSLIHI